MVSEVAGEGRDDKGMEEEITVHENIEEWRPTPLKEELRGIYGLLYNKFPRLNDKDYKDLVYKTEISMKEFMLIFAYQMDRAISKAKKSNKFPKYAIKEMEEDNYWIRSWKVKKEVNGIESWEFEGVDEAIYHLTQVQGWFFGEYGFDYVFTYLLDYDKTYYDVLVRHYKVKDLETGADEIVDRWGGN